MEKVKEQIQQIQEVNYRNISMTACVKKDGTIYVNIKNICDGLGIDYSSQLKRINRDDMLPQGVVKMTIPSSGGEQETNMMLITFLPFFLTGIKTSMVKPEIAKNLFDFKLKAKDVLAAAFLPPQYQPQSPNPLLEQSIMSLQQSQQNLINCTMEQGYQLANHEEQIESINESVANIEKSLKHDFIYADRWDEVQNEFYHLNSIVDDLRKELQNQTVNKVLDNNSIDQMDVVRDTIKPLGEKLHDRTIGYKTTYRKVYTAMKVNWKYRMTRWSNLNGCKEQLRKIDLVTQDDRLFELFKVTVAKMLEN